MQVAARPSWEALAWGSPLARALVAGRMPPGLQVVDLHQLPLLAPRPGGSRALLLDLLEEVPADLRGPWQALLAPEACVVVTGQQPGCAGGALLVLYKAATAVALARRAARLLARPVVPLFWNGTDDEDFEEIARVAWPDAARGLLFLELPAEARRPGGWVGDLPADGDARAAAAAIELVTPAARPALQLLLPVSAIDHGDWVARLLQAVFPELAVLDARSPALRRHAAPLFGRYLERRELVREALDRSAAELQAQGLTPRIAPESRRTGLFLTVDRQRRKIGDDAGPLRQALATAPETLSPNIVLRPLVQDELLPVLAHVVGPAEIDYLVELRPARALLGVPQPALVPRLTLTLAEAALLQEAAQAHLDPLDLLREPEAALRDAAATRAQAAVSRLDIAFQDLQRDIASVGDQAGASLQRSARRLEALRREVAEEVRAAARARLLAEYPALAAAPALLRPRQQEQERRVAGLWLAARWGSELRPRLLELAGSHLDDLQERRASQALVSL